jgi:hypothetical protein
MKKGKKDQPQKDKRDKKSAILCMERQKLTICKVKISGNIRQSELKMGISGQFLV